MTTDKKNTLTDHLKTHWVAYLLGIVIIILLFILLNPGKPIESNKYQLEMANKKYKEQQDSTAEVNRRDKIKSEVIISQDSVIHSIRVENEGLRREMDKTKAISQRLAKEIKQIQPEDTSVYSKKVDELIVQNENLISQKDQYVARVDSLNAVVDKQKATYEERIRDKVKLIADMSRAATESNTAYNTLSVKDDKTNKRLSNQLVVKKSLIVVVLVETAVIIFKK